MLDVLDKELAIASYATPTMDLALARGDGRYARILRTLGGVQLLNLDWGLEPLDAAARHDLLEILEGLRRLGT
jgi:hypothetical protein